VRTFLTRVTVAVICGGARGTGALHARTMVREEAKVVAIDILDNEGKALAGELDAVGAVGQTSFQPKVRVVISEPGQGLKRRATVPIRALFGGPQVGIHQGGG